MQKEFQAMPHRLPQPSQTLASSMSSSATVTPLSPAFASPSSPSSPANAHVPDHPLDAPIAFTTKTRSLGWLQALLPGLASNRMRMANIQRAMVAELSQVATLPLHEELLARQIIQATDIETLWELRRALSDQIAAACGDLVAHQKMTEISFMFAGMLRRRNVDHEHDDHHGRPVGENVVRLHSRNQQPSASP